MGLSGLVSDQNQECDVWPALVPLLSPPWGPGPDEDGPCSASLGSSRGSGHQASTGALAGQAALVSLMHPSENGPFIKMKPLA